jgi:hypothetical protein
MDVEKFLLLVKDQEAIYNASRCEPEPRLTLMMMFITDILMGDKCGLLVLPRTVPVEGVLSVTAKRQVKPYGTEYAK